MRALGEANSQVMNSINNNNSQTITLPKVGVNQDMPGAQDTIYLCNFRVSVDGDWLCLKELQNLDIQDPNSANQKAGSGNGNRRSFVGGSGVDGTNNIAAASASSCHSSSNNHRQLTGFDSIIVGTQDKHTTDTNRSDWANFYSRDPASIERSNLVNICKLVVKELLEQSLRFGRMLDSDHLPLQHFFIVLEHVLRHGLRPKKGLLGPKKELWDILQSVEKYSFEAQDITASVRDLPTVKTAMGRARAWLRIALMQKKLADYLQALVDNREEALAEYYEPHALMMSEEIILIMGILVGLNVIDCNLCVKEEDLDSQQGVIDFSLYLRSSSRTSPDDENNHHSTNVAVVGETGNNMSAVLDQKNYIEELNRHLNATVTNLQSKVESLTTTNALMKEDLAIARNSLLSLQAENQALRQGKQSDHSGPNPNAIDRLDPEMERQFADERKKRQEVERELDLQVSLKAETEMAMKLLEKDIHEKQDTIISLRRQLEDIKQINLEMYKKLQECESSLKHKTELISKLESQKETMANAILKLDDKVVSENLSIAAMQEQSQVLSMQMVSCEERLARAETDLRVEREWRNSLQTKEVQLKEQINGLQMQVRDQNQEIKKGAKYKQELEALTTKYQDSEKTLEELGFQLSTSKLLIAELKDKQRNQINTSDPDGLNASGNGNALGEWQPDKLITSCKGCNREFSITRRKHHCRKCGQIFCNTCSEHVIPLPNTTDGQLGKPVRVCDTCWIQLNTARN